MYTSLCGDAAGQERGPLQHWCTLVPATEDAVDGMAHGASLKAV